MHFRSLFLFPTVIDTCLLTVGSTDSGRIFPHRQYGKFVFLLHMLFSEHAINLSKPNWTNSISRALRVRLGKDIDAKFIMCWILFKTLFESDFKRWIFWRRQIGNDKNYLRLCSTHTSFSLYLLVTCRS